MINLRHGLELVQDDALDLAWDLNLELDLEKQAGMAYLGKKWENRPYKRKLAEKESKDKTPKGKVIERSQKSTNVAGVWALPPLARVESKLEKTDELELHEGVYEDWLQHLTPEEGFQRRYGTDYLNILRSGTSAAQLVTLRSHKQDEGLYAGDDHAHQDLLAVRRCPEEGAKQDHAMDERGLGMAAAAQKA